MLELRPNCELCDVDLPAQSPEARICSYECTYCADCADNDLKNVCPTCGGNLCPRPVHPNEAYLDGLSLGLKNHSAGTTRRHTRWSPEEIESMVLRLKDIPPAQR